MKTKLIIEIEDDLKAEFKGKAYSLKTNMQKLIVEFIENWNKNN